MQRLGLRFGRSILRMTFLEATNGQFGWLDQRRPLDPRGLDACSTPASAVQGDVRSGSDLNRWSIRDLS